MTQRRSRLWLLIGLAALFCLVLLAWPQGNSEAQSLFEGLVTTPTPTATPVPTPTPSPTPAVTPASASAPAPAASVVGLDPMILTLLGTPTAYPGNGSTVYVFRISSPASLLPAMMLLDMEQVVSFHFDRTTMLFTLTTVETDSKAAGTDQSQLANTTTTTRTTTRDDSYDAREECFSCDGLGDCYECDGTGYERCINCFGSGDCRKCSGNSEVKCSTCRGNGECTKYGGDSYR